jgi:hypothetical protein
MSNTQNNEINKYIVCIAHPAYKNEWLEQTFETTKDKLKHEVTKKIYEEIYESLKSYVELVGGSNDISVEKIKKLLISLIFLTNIFNKICMLLIA